MSELTFSNVVIYAIQILAVVAMAAAVARVVPMPLPAGRLLYWRTVVVAGLVLPLGTLLLRGIAARRVTGFALTVDAVTSAASTDIAGIPILQVVAAVFVLGAVLRILWLAVGLARMARLRAGASPARLGPAVEALRQEIAPYAVVARHDAVLQPITFGLRHPIVLVPDTFESLPAEIQRAVVCHELLHVKRHDWAWRLIEEGIRSLFWCHPGMRWAVSKIQASREEVVDAAAIARTGARREYMTALLSFAGVPAFRPAIRSSGTITWGRASAELPRRYKCLELD